MSIAPDKLIVIRRTHILVYGHRERNSAAFKELETLLSVRVKELSGASWVTFKAMLTDTDPKGREVLRLPGEVPEELLRRVWPSHLVDFGKKAWPRRAVQVRFHVRDFPYKNENQQRIVQYLINPDNAGISRLVVAGTAVGKSYCSIRAWTLRSDVLLGTFAQILHMENFKAELLKFTDLTEDDILVVDEGRVSIRRAMRNPELLDRIKVVLVLHRTAWFAMQEKITDGAITGANEFVQFVLAVGVGTHISDEAHLEYQSLTYLAMMLNISQTYYLTATPNRTDWMEDRVLSTVLPKDFALTIKSERRLEALQIRFDTKPDQFEVAKSVNRRDFFDIPVFFDYLMQDSKWSIIEEMLTRCISKSFENGGESVGIVVAGKLEFLDRVVDRMTAAFPDKTVGNFSSRVKKEIRMDELHKDIVVTTEKSLGASVNPVRMTHLIFLAPLASPVLIEQITGRLRGINDRPCILYDLWDAGFPKLIEQAKRRRTTYRKIVKVLREGSYDPVSGECKFNN